MAKLGDGLKVKYEPIWPQAPVDMKFHYYEELEDGTKVLRMHEENFKLISSVEELKEFAKQCEDKVIGFDTETTGLSYNIDKIVGFSISLDAYSGVYVPIRHKEQLFVEREEQKVDKEGNLMFTKAGKPLTKVIKETIIKDSPANLDPKQSLDVLYNDILLKAKRVLAHNAEFDLNMLKFEGYDINKIKFFDTLILPYLFDPEAKALAGLKALEKRVLGRTVPEFKEVLGKKYENFALVAPKDGYVYACHDKETEVLTEHGWVKWEVYNGTDKLATINLDNDTLEYQAPTKLYKYIYNGEMECCNSASINYCVTPNHNMIVKQGQGKSKFNKWVLKEAQRLNVEEVALTAPLIWNSTIDNVQIGSKKYSVESIAPILALILADGFCSTSKERHRVGTCVSSKKNYEYLTNIIKESPFKWTPYTRKGSIVTSWECLDKDLWSFLKPYAGHKAYNKSVPPFMFNSSKRAIDSFLMVYSMTDGHRYTSGSIRYYTTSKQMKDDLQRLLMISGKRSSVHVRNPEDKEIQGRTIKGSNCHTLYTINVNSCKTTRYKKHNRFTKPYNDYVYCAEVPNHTLITRRNGKTLVSGNCCDTSGVVGIYEKMYPEVRKLLNKHKPPMVFDGVPYDVLSNDNKMVRMFVDYYGHCKIIINKEKALKYKEELETEQKQVIKKIYEYFDRGVFNLSASSKEFKDVMASKEVFTGVLTDKKQPSWSKSAAEEMKRNINKIKECLHNWKSIRIEQGKISKEGMGFQLCQMLELYGKPYFNMKSTIKNMTVKGKKNEPMDLRLFWLTVKHMYEKESEKLYILGLIHRNNSLNKALNSYVDKLTQVNECIMHYRLKGTKSGRLSSGNGSKSDKNRNQYYIDLNAQNLTKPASGYYVAEECPMDDEEGVLGWRFTPVDKDYAMEHLEDKYIVEGQDPNITIRGCLEAPKGEVVQSIIPASEVTDKEGFEPSTDEEVYEVEMDNGTVIKCCDSTVFKVKVKGQVMYMPFKDIKHDSNAEIVEE